MISEHKFDTSTCCNVLNVVKDLKDRLELISLCHEALKKDGIAYFQIYEGSKSGRGKVSRKDCWQNNRVTAEYVGEVLQSFEIVSRVGNTIVAVK